MESLLLHIERDGGRTLNEIGAFSGLKSFFKENPECCKDVPTTLEWVEHMMSSATWSRTLKSNPHNTPL
jgi:hypothetical protein